MTSQDLSIDIPIDAVDSLPAVQESIFQKYKIYIICGSISAIVGVFLILWLVVGIFDKKPSPPGGYNQPDVSPLSITSDQSVAPLELATLQLVPRANDLQLSWDNAMTLIYEENNISFLGHSIGTTTYIIHWFIDALQYKNTKTGQICAFPKVMDDVKIPETIPARAATYGPYQLMTPVIIQITKSRDRYEIDTKIDNEYKYPAGSIFSFTVDNQLNVTFTHELHPVQKEHYIMERKIENPLWSGDPPIISFKANPSNLDIRYGHNNFTRRYNYINLSITPPTT
jgi:hypothetical protein